MITRRVNSLDEKYMVRALELAQKAAKLDEVPVGAVLVGPDGIVLAEAHNEREMGQSALAHAELLVIERSCNALGAWRLEGCTLFVTLEPCLMCAGGILQARIPRVVIGTLDPKAGAVRSMYQTLEDARLNHRCEIVTGVLAEDCSRILSDFFKTMRKRKD